MRSLPFPSRSTPATLYSLQRRRGGGQWPLLLKLAVAGGLAALLAAVIPTPSPARQADEPATVPPTLSLAGLSLEERSSSHVHIYTPYSGVVMEKHVSEGQQVEKGETLYVLFSEPPEKAVTNRQHAASERLRRRLDALRRDMVQAHDAHAAELDAVRRGIHDTRSKLSWTTVQMKGQKSVVEEAVSAVPHRGPQREPLWHGASDNWQAQAQAAMAHLREQEARLRVLETRHRELDKTLAEQKRSLHALPLQQANALARIQRAMSETSNEIDLNDGRRRIVVAAPQAGVATTVTAQVGHRVDERQPLLGMMPTDWRAIDMVCPPPPSASDHCI